MTSEQCIAALATLNDERLRAAAVDKLGEGWSAWVFAAPNGWAYRFPTSPIAADAMVATGAMLDRLHDAAALPLPRYIAWGTFRGLPFAVYRKIEGVGFEECQRGERLSSDLASLLGAIHAHRSALNDLIPTRPMGPSSPPPDPRPRVGRGPDQTVAWPDSWTARCAALLAAAEPLLATFPRRARRGVERDSRMLTERVLSIAPTLCHGDLLAEHILLDPKTGGLAGVIDWDDAMCADPAWDIGVLATTASARFIEELMNAYGADPDMRVRVALYARLALLKEAVDAMTCGLTVTASRMVGALVAMY